MTDLQALDAFSGNCLEIWDKRSNVRRRDHYRIPADQTEAAIEGVQLPLLRRPEVAALPSRDRRFLKAQALYFWKNQIALLETEVTGALAAQLANKAGQVPLPWSARQVALTIDVDERYHAYVERDFILQLAAASGIPVSAIGASPALVTAVELARAATPEEHRVDLDVVLLCLIENTITAELFGLHKENPPAGPFYDSIAEHLADEGRHAAFFRQLLAYYWPALDEHARRSIGNALPAFFEANLCRPAPEAIRCASAWLTDLGLSAGAARELAAASFPPQSPGQNPLWPGLRNTMERCGLLAHKPTLAALSEAGWTM